MEMVHILTEYSWPIKIKLTTYNNSLILFNTDHQQNETRDHETLINIQNWDAKQKKLQKKQEVVGKAAYINVILVKL